MMSINRVLIVAGNFDDLGGSPSGYAAKVFDDTMFPDTTIMNGGSWQDLEDAMRDIDVYDAVLWFPNIDNSKPKLVRQIKQQNRRCMLVTSKNNTGDRYSSLEIISRALDTKSNLLVEFKKNDGLVYAKVWDALGNVFFNSSDPVGLKECLASRINVLSSYTRIGSKKVGDALAIPNEERFFEIARGYASRFHELIHAVNSERFVGNLSFRCENGFASFRHDNVIYISRRNIDKRDIGVDGFVAVSLKDLDQVHFYGNNKPSVDAPIQSRLYDYFPNINYMIHSHAYIEHRPFTNKVVPCGAIEEVDEITSIVSEESYFFARNLLGHGSIVGSNHVCQLNDIRYIAREFPEVQYESRN